MLADRVAAPPYLRPGWIAAWWRAFGTGTLDIFMARRGGRLVGLLPLCRRRTALVSPTNWHSPGFGLVAEPGVSAGFAEQILADRRGAHRVSLAFVDPGSEDIGAWRGAAATHGFRVLTRTLARFASVEIHGDWDAFDRGLSRNLRGDVRRSFRRLQEVGDVRFEHLDGLEQLDQLLTEAFRVESSGWKGARGTAIASRPETERFYREVSAWAAQRGKLRVAVLRLDGRAIAFELGIEERGVHYALKAGFDPAHRAFSPGKLLIHQILERSFSIGLSRYEMAGVEGYKLAWANAFRDVALVQAFAPSAMGFVDWAAFRYGRPIAKRALTALPSRRARASRRDTSQRASGDASA
jgi:CelD/BcsL family acetyltransferase involved in cellulose biosynthesis